MTTILKRIYVLPILFMMIGSVSTAYASTTQGPANLVPNPNFWQNGSTENTVVQAINNAHNKENIPTISLPSNYDALTKAEKLLVITNLERGSYGLSPVLGLNETWDTYAMKGAQSDSDPTPIGNDYLAWASNWAGLNGSVLEADYLWMYQDGPGGYNIECTSKNTTGCYGHRENILTNWKTMMSYAGWSPNEYNMIMGAAYTNDSYTELYGAVPTPIPSLYFTWAQELPYFDQQTLPNGVSGKSYSYQLHGVNGTEGYRWNVVGEDNGNIGSGLTVNSNGLITGVPTTSGNISFQVKVTDSSGNVVGEPTLMLNIVSSQFTTAQWYASQGQWYNAVYYANQAIEAGYNNKTVQNFMQNMSKKLDDLAFEHFPKRDQTAINAYELLMNTKNVPASFQKDAHINLETLYYGEGEWYSNNQNSYNAAYYAQKSIILGDTNSDVAKFMEMTATALDNTAYQNYHKGNKTASENDYNYLESLKYDVPNPIHVDAIKNMEYLF